MWPPSLASWWVRGLNGLISRSQRRSLVTSLSMRHASGPQVSRRVIIISCRPIETPGPNWVSPTGVRNRVIKCWGDPAQIRSHHEDSTFYHHLIMSLSALVFPVRVIIIIHFSIFSLRDAGRRTVGWRTSRPTWGPTRGRSPTCASSLGAPRPSAMLQTEPSIKTEPIQTR